MKNSSNFRFFVFFLYLPILFIGCNNSTEDTTKILQKAKSTEYIVEYLDYCNKLKDPSLITNLVLNADLWGKRKLALEFLTDETLLQKVIQESQDENIRFNAEKRLQEIKQKGTVNEIPITLIQVIRDGSVKDARNDPTAKFKEAIATP
jgi:Fe2+ transport system protein B